jgi:chloramphenicol O-acetyltransferase type A
MKERLDIESWSRKEHFLFFKQFEEPFFGVTVEIDCTKAYSKVKELKTSFFLYYLHKSLQAANHTEPFRYRIKDDQIFVYEKVNASPTINRPDGTFGFAYIEFFESFEKFSAEARIVIDQVQNSKELLPAKSGENVIHCSSVPWIKFTAVSHARRFSFNDSCPKIVFGKMTTTGKKKTMPVAVHVNHALMDGYHVGLFLDEFQKLMNE